MKSHGETHGVVSISVKYLYETNVFSSVNFMLFFPQALDEEIGFIAEGKKQFIYLFLIVENIGPVYSSQRVKVSSGLQANFTGRVTLSPGSTLPAFLTCFVMRNILCNV